MGRGLRQRDRRVCNTSERSYHGTDGSCSRREGWWEWQVVEEKGEGEGKRERDGGEGWKERKGGGRNGGKRGKEGESRQDVKTKAKCQFCRGYVWNYRSTMYCKCLLAGAA